MKARRVSYTTVQGGTRRMLPTFFVKNIHFCVNLWTFSLKSSDTIGRWNCELYSMQSWRNILKVFLKFCILIEGILQRLRTDTAFFLGIIAGIHRFSDEEYKSIWKLQNWSRLFNFILMLAQYSENWEKNIQFSWNYTYYIARRNLRTSEGWNGVFPCIIATYSIIYRLPDERMLVHWGCKIGSYDSIFLQGHDSTNSV